MGPPMVPPHCCWLVSGLARLFCFAKNSRPRQRGILEERSAAVEVVGALLRHRVDHRADGAAVLGVELAGDDLELLDRFDRRARLWLSIVPVKVPLKRKKL